MRVDILLVNINACVSSMALSARHRVSSVASRGVKGGNSGRAFASEERVEPRAFVSVATEERKGLLTR